jgi:hypothetical protein
MGWVMTSSIAASVVPNRVLGALGVLGGAVLLAAFVVGIPGDINTIRLVLFNLGAIAVALASLRYRATTSRLVRGVTWLTVIANAWYLVMVVLSIGRPVPPLPDPEFRLVMSYAGLAMWLTDAALGFVTLRVGDLTRWGAIALGFGSLLAILGMSHLQLTSPANPTIIGPLSLIGIALNGIGWILLGGDLVLRDRARS